MSYTFLFWLPNYISTTSRIDARESAVLSTLFDLGGILGGVLAGAVSDHTGMNATTCAVMLVAAIPTLSAYQVKSNLIPSNLIQTDLMCNLI